MDSQNLIPAEAKLETKISSFTNMEEMFGYAEKLIASGFLPSVLKKPEQVVSIILTGKELGFDPMTSIGNIHIIQGKPVLGIHALAALLAKAGVAYKIIQDAELVDDGQDLITTIRFYKKWYGETITNDISFRFSDAVAQGLATKDNWKKMRRLMMLHRCLGIGARFTAPEALLGLYTVQEMADANNVNYTVSDEGTYTILE